MFTYYTIGKSGVKKATQTDYNWLVIQDETAEELTEILEKYRLPDDIFIGGDQPEEVSRLEYLQDTRLAAAISLVLIDLTEKTDQSIEKRLQPVSFISSKELLITYVCPGSKVVDHLLEREQKNLVNFEKVIAYTIFHIYNHFILELREKKELIDQLDNAARKTTENQELFNLANAERDMVYLDHTLNDQRETMEDLWKNETFVKRLADESLVHDIKLRQRQADKLVDIYRDLLETIGGLFSDMMDNNLNHLMKYLDSAALVISIPALISGIWGMNTGGLPGENSKIGFFIVMGLATLMAITAAFHLSRKDYSK